MTRNQVSAVLNDFGYDLNQKLKLDEVSSIYVVLDHMLYPDGETEFEFYAPNNNQNINLLLVYEHGNEEPTYFIPFECIAGFHFVNEYRIKMPFGYGRSV